MANTLLNQIFYDINKFDVEPTICERFMLLQEYVDKIKPVEIIENIEPEKNNVVPEHSEQL